MFGGVSLTETHRQKVEALVKEKQAEGPDQVMLRAVTGVRLGEGSLDLEFYPAKRPPMLEVAPGHRVACYLYPGGSDRGAPMMPP